MLHKVINEYDTKTLYVYLDQCFQLLNVDLSPTIPFRVLRAHSIPNAQVNFRIREHRTGSNR